MGHRILSGIQPSGRLTLGNYLGAIRNWVQLQNHYECLFCIVDLHAITVPYHPSELSQFIRELAATYLAAGIDSEKHIIFIQSHVPAHAQLAWLLGCMTPMGWLNRMTQFKEKAGKHRETASLGLYAYPVLMAADILVYQATHVPVGDDQKQHLELARDIAQSFNNRFDQAFFTLPEPLIFGTATRVMSLRDGTKKMSKTDESDYSRINLDDSPETILQKIRKAKTDPEPLPATVSALETRPEARNLVNIYAALSHQSLEDVIQQFAGAAFSTFKPQLAELLIETLRPIQERRAFYLKDPAELDRLLKKGAIQANALANVTLRKVSDIMGFIPPYVEGSANCSG
jgi:tryptophanyl-tRNA synthetase